MLEIDAQSFGLARLSGLNTRSASGKNIHHDRRADTRRSKGIAVGKPEIMLNSIDGDGAYQAVGPF
jgi:hypothetical protein